MERWAALPCAVLLSAILHGAVLHEAALLGRRAAERRAALWTVMERRAGQGVSGGNCGRNKRGLFLGRGRVERNGDGGDLRTSGNRECSPKAWHGRHGLGWGGLGWRCYLVGATCLVRSRHPAAESGVRWARLGCAPVRLGGGASGLSVGESCLMLGSARCGGELGGVVGGVGSGGG